MIFINEFLPNPVGSDVAGEWVELFNSGNTAVNVNGWTLKNSGRGSYTLKGTISAGEYLVLPRNDTKLTLKNTDEAVFLYDAQGTLVDQSRFYGEAPEGKSFSRISGVVTAGQHFGWSDPTPAAANGASLNAAIVHNAYPAGVPLNGQLGAAGIFGMMLGTAALLSALVLFIVKRNENLSNILFARDEEIG